YFCETCPCLNPFTPGLPLTQPRLTHALQPFPAAALVITLSRFSKLRSLRCRGVTSSSSSPLLVRPQSRTPCPPRTPSQRLPQDLRARGAASSVGCPCPSGRVSRR
ncbi:hypothetical protein T484DRAFT_1921218, partial [Baffinella frigidus]